MKNKPNDLTKILHFIQEHHVLSLATSHNDRPSVCSLFYAFDESVLSFIVASSEETHHIKQVEDNKYVAGNILLETKTVGKIQGLQFFATMQKVSDEKMTKCYFQEFAYARALRPTLWQIKVSSFKFTDNRLGFGKKIIYECSSL